jgi:hypothetical protein
MKKKKEKQDEIEQVVVRQAGKNPLNEAVVFLLILLQKVKLSVGFMQNTEAKAHYHIRDG